LNTENMKENSRFSNQNFATSRLCVMNFRIFYPDFLEKKQMLEPCHIAIISHKTRINNIRISGGISAYLGGIRMMNDTVYVVKNNAWTIESDTGNKGKFAKRHYFGADFQFSTVTVAGLTQLRAEYIFGEHPGNAANMYRGLSALPAETAKTYMRNINGGYIVLTQHIGTLPLAVVAKYDWYNQNTKLSGDNVQERGDLSYSTVGFGTFWDINSSLRLTAYYDIVTNEKSKNVNDGKDFNDNVFTLRLQYKF